MQIHFGLQIILYFTIGLLLSIPFGYEYDFKILLGLLSSNKEIVEDSIKNVEAFKYEIILFNSIMSLIAFCFGLLFNNLVLKLNLDTRFPYLRFHNVWHYLLTAKFISLGRSQIELSRDSIQDTDLTYVVALVNIAGKAILYNGILVDYELSKEWSLDLIYLKGVKRREISESRESYIDVEGHILILKYDYIINLNLSFIATDIVNNEQGKIIAIETRLIE